MSIKTVKFPFTSFNGIETHYSLELQGYLTREEFDQRIIELSETSKRSRINRFLVFFPLFIVLLAIGIVLPLVFARQLSNINSFFDFKNFEQSSRNSFTIWAWTILGIFVGFILALILTSCLGYKSRANQFRAYTKKLNEFNVNDNPKGINWRIDSNTGYINLPRTVYNSYKHSRELYTQKYLVIEVGPPSFFMNNNQMNVLQVVNHTPTIEASPPAYHESVKDT